MNIVSTKKEVNGFDQIEKILQDMANKSGVAHQVVIYSAEDIDYCKTVKPEKSKLKPVVKVCGVIQDISVDDIQYSNLHR